MCSDGLGPEPSEREEATMAEPVPVVERVPVPFTGETAGEEDLTWGQAHMLLSMLQIGRSLSMSAVRPLVDGVTVADIAAEVAFYLTRFEAMRTRVRFDPDGGIRQVVARSGTATVDIVAAADDADPAQVAEAVVAEHDRVPFDYVTEWPLRAALVRHRGRLTHFVLTIAHHVADGPAGLVMYHDWTRRDLVTGRPTAPLGGIGPLELARRQRETAHRRQSDAALRHWENLLRTVPPRRFPEPTAAVPTQRHWMMAYESPAAFLALQVLTDRTGGDPAAALLATFAVALARATGSHPVVLQSLVGNRFRPGFADIVSPLTQTALCVIDVADCSFADAVRAARARSTVAYKHAYFDRRALTELVTRVNGERGEEIDTGVIFNDRRGEVRRPPVLATPDEIAAARAGRRLRPDKPLDRFNERLMMNFNACADRVSVEVTVDTHHVPPDLLDAILTELETVAVQAAADPSAHTGVRAHAVHAARESP
jgi:hypothetical protein